MSGTWLCSVTEENENDCCRLARAEADKAECDYQKQTLSKSAGLIRSFTDDGLSSSSP